MPWTHDRTWQMFERVTCVIFGVTYTKNASYTTVEGILAERPRFRRASPSGISWGSLIEVKHIGITDLRSSGAFPLNDPYESELSTGHPSKKHRS